MWKTNPLVEFGGGRSDTEATVALTSAFEQMMRPLAVVADEAGLHRIAFLMNEIVEEAQLSREITLLEEDERGMPREAIAVRRNGPQYAA